MAWDFTMRCLSPSCRAAMGSSRIQLTFNLQMTRHVVQGFSSGAVHLTHLAFAACPASLLRGKAAPGPDSLSSCILLHPTALAAVTCLAGCLSRAAPLAGREGPEAGCSDVLLAGTADGSVSAWTLADGDILLDARVHCAAVSRHEKDMHAEHQPACV